MALLKQSTAYVRTFFMVQSTDHITAKTGASPSVSISKNGAAFGAAAGTVTELTVGFYKISLTTTDTNTLGDLSFSITGTGADPVGFIDQVIAVDLADATAFGLSRIDAAVSSRSTYAGGAVASVTAGVTVATNNDKTGYTVSTVSDKTGYSLSASQTYNVTGNRTGNVTGSVGSVTADVGITQAAADKVWGTTVRSLSTFGTLVADIATAVWGAATRTLTAFGFTVTTSVSAGDITNIADGVLKRDMSAVSGESSRSLLNAIRFLRNRWKINAGTLTIYKEDDTTAAWTAPVTTTAGSNPITEVDPT